MQFTTIYEFKQKPNKYERNTIVVYDNGYLGIEFKRKYGKPIGKLFITKLNVSYLVKFFKDIRNRFLQENATFQLDFDEVEILIEVLLPRHENNLKITVGEYTMTLTSDQVEKFIKEVEGL